LGELIDLDLKPTGDEMENEIKKIAKAISGGESGVDAMGGHVGSLTDAVMGVTQALVRIADALEKNTERLEDIRNTIDYLANTLDEKDFND